MRPLFKPGLQKSRCMVCGRKFLVDITELEMVVASPAEATITFKISVPPDDRLDHAQCINVVQERSR